MPIKALGRVLVNGYDLSSESTSLSVATAVNTVEWQTIDQSTANTLPDTPTSNITHNGYFSDEDPGGLENQLYDALGTTDATYITALLGTQLTVPVGYTLESAWSDQMTVTAAAGELITVEGNWLSRATDVPMLRGYLLHSGLANATGPLGTAVDFGAAGAAGGFAHLHVTAVVGTATSATITVQGSTALAMTTPVTLGTFTFSGNSTTGIQSVRISLGTGTVHRYQRLNVTSLGGATSFTIVAVSASKGVTY